MPSRRQRKLDVVVAGLQLQYGPCAVRRAAGQHAEPISCIATTFPELDAALVLHGRGGAEEQRSGGLPRGRISEIIGPATSGKVTLAAKVLAAAQRERDALVAWLDLGRTCDPDYLDRCGLDLDRLLIVHPEDGADALAIALHLVESNTLAALVFDGLADLSPGDEPLARARSASSVANVTLSGLTSQLPRRQAASEESLRLTGRDSSLSWLRRGVFGTEPLRMTSRIRSDLALAPPGLVDGTLERLATVVTQTQTVVLFLTEPYAQSRTLAHIATVRLAIRRERWITRAGDVRGYDGRVEILKHKLGRAGALVPIRIMFNGTVHGDRL
jgi:recA bacterial DNA recombination protein